MGLCTVCAGLTSCLISLLSDICCESEGISRGVHITLISAETVTAEQEGCSYPVSNKWRLLNNLMKTQGTNQSMEAAGALVCSSVAKKCAQDGAPWTRGEQCAQRAGYCESKCVEGAVPLAESAACYAHGYNTLFKKLKPCCHTAPHLSYSCHPPLYKRQGTNYPGATPRLGPHRKKCKAPTRPTRVLAPSLGTPIFENIYISTKTFLPFSIKMGYTLYRFFSMLEN